MTASRRPTRRRRVLIALALAALAAPASTPGVRAADASTARRPGRPAAGPPAIAQPSPARPLVVLKIGDSLGEELGFGLRDVLGASPDVRVLQEAVGDTGLARPDYYNWPLHLDQELARFRPRAVVVLLGANDAQNFVSDGRVVEFGSPAWQRIYGARVGTIMREATAAGAHVLWLGLPIMASPAFSAKVARINAIYAAEAGAHRGVNFLATWSLFANAHGGYAAYLPDASGHLVLMRNPDGIHFSEAGDDRLATALVGAMERDWRIRLRP